MHARHTRGRGTPRRVRPARTVDRRCTDRGRGGRTLPVHDPATGRVLCEVADASVADGRRALDASVEAQEAWAETAPRDRGEILRRAFELMIERADQLALLMTLEMGKPLAESHAEVTVRRGVPALVQRGVRPHRGAVRHLARRRDAPAHPEAAGRPDDDDHPVELPARHGDPEDRPGRGGGLHDAGQAGGADPAVDVRPRLPHAGGRPPRRRPERGDHLDERCRDGAADPGQPGPQADLHGLDRRRPSPRRAVRRSSSCGCRWSSAATRRSWSCRTPTSTTPWTAPCSPRCATWARPAPPRTGSWCTGACVEEFTARLAARMGALRVWDAEPSPACRSGR